MRGKLDTGLDTVRILRIIPAHAGQTGEPNNSVSVLADHPRACGANCSVYWNPANYRGSSPRMRGKLGDSR